MIFPDLDHLATCGDTLEEAFAMAVDCLAGYLYNARQMGETVPEPSPLDRIDPDVEYDEYEEVFINLVTVDVAEYAKRHFERSVKKTLTIPKWLNDKAECEQINFSQLLQAALRQKLGL